ncbi:MAG: VapC toxin family PIN domain ribonuclease [Gammaproteobacteria bacterium]|nr:VapC toxin family PIN domain ribonuclease [Gammaproteobacteria bacterium]
MRALFDINVLIALLDTDHVGHEAATAWFADNLKQGWASCPITENGTARIMASPGYPNHLSVAAVLQRLTLAKGTGHHQFWADDLSLTDAAVFNHAKLLGPKQITDRYLLALAVKNDGRFVTFDQAIRPTAVAGASTKHLVRIPE